jgi:hypothetical protein
MSNYCTDCGAEQIEDSKVCSACGKEFEQHTEIEKQPQLKQEEQQQTPIPKSTTKKSRKKLIIGIATIIIAMIIISVLIIYFLDGINSFGGTDSRFIGEWEQNIVGSPLLWKFNSDGTLEKESASAGTWTVKNGQLCLNNSRCYTFEFSNNGSALTMNRSGESDIIFTKKDQQGTSQTPNIKCITNSTTNRLIITSIDENVIWRDIEITTNPIATWQVQDSNKNQLAKIGTTATIVRYVTLGDNIYVLDPVGDIIVNMTYIPTNALLGTWRVNV